MTEEEVEDEVEGKWMKERKEEEKEGVGTGKVLVKTQHRAHEQSRAW